MSKTLSDLIADLQSEVAAVNSVPTAAQYKQAIKDAVVEFSRRCGLEKFGTINIIAGTATYALADDFLKLIALWDFPSVDGVIISSSGLIPVPLNYVERHIVSNKQITFMPTPAYGLIRNYRYKAAWILTGTDPNETYAGMGEDEAQIVMIKAKALATEKLLNATAASGGMKYSFGAVSVDKGTGVDDLSKRMYQLHDDFIKACNEYNGAAIA